MEEWCRKIKQNSVVKLLLLIGAVYFFLKYLSPLLSPVLVAMLFVTIFGPLLKKMKAKFHIHRQVGAVLLLAAALGVLTVILWLLGNWMWKSFPDLLQKVESWKNVLPQWAFGMYDNFLKSLKSGEAQIEKGLVSLCIRYTGKAAILGGYLVTFVIAVALLAKDYDELMNRLLDREDCHLLLEVICSVIRYIATYVKAQGVIMLLITVMCAVTLWVSGVRQGIFWGLLAGLLDALPFIGTGIILVPLTVLQFLDGKIWRALICVLLYIVCIFVRQILEPKLIGRKIGVNPIVVLISLYVGIRLFGLAGIIKGPLGFIIVWEIWQRCCGQTSKDL